MYLRISDTVGVSVDTCDYYGEGQIITRIYVPPSHRGKGWGSTALRKLLEHADEKRITLFLEINPYGPLNYEQLAAWYERHGFEQFVMDMWRRKPK